MKHLIPIILTVITCFFTQSYAQISQREISFDENWKFSLQDVKGAKNPEYDDATWRNLDLPNRICKPPILHNKDC